MRCHRVYKGIIVSNCHSLSVSLNQLITICVTRYRMQDGSQQPWLTLRVIPASTMSMTVFNLHSDMLYQFMVLSRIHVGDGLFSEIVASRTKGTHNFYVGYTGGDQSMEKSVFYGILSFILVYRPMFICGRFYGFS